MKNAFLQDKNIPENIHGLYNVFLGEYFWAPAFQYHNIPYYNHPGWEEFTSESPYQVLITSDPYLRDESHDRSLEESIRFLLPCEWLVEKLGLNWGGDKAKFFNRHGDLVAFDPSLHTEGPSALLVNKKILTDFLSDSDYDLLWVIQGEKRISDGKEILDSIEISGLGTMENGDLSFHINTRRFTPMKWRKTKNS